VADFVWHPNAWFFDYALVMSAWMIISICGGLYLLGMFRLPHDTASDHIGVARLVFAMTFLGLASYLAVGLFGPEKPTGKIWENIASFAPPRFEAGEDEQGPYHEHGGLKYSLDFNRAMQYARQRQLPVFIDFTGVNCTNCRKMEGGPMSKPHVTELLKDFVRVQLYVDRVPTIRDEALAQQLKETNQRLQEKFGNVGLPTYFLITPEQRPTILGRFEGMELVDGDFAEFLDRGLERWAGLQQMGRVEQPAQPDVAIR
jgi:thiol:disulfide interchange protein DsbD